MTRELKKVGYVYCTFNQLQTKLIGHLMWHKNKKKEIIYNWTIETNLGINFVIEKTIKNSDYCDLIYWPIFGYNAAALEKFKNHTNLNYLSLREYESLKGGAPYQVFKSNDKFINDHFTFISYE
tara:strand:- start:1144 stop:1515 length:372 start_codon:yes stop_codon:yes gene_type:complete